MSDFTLPHHHGENAHAASLHKELMNLEIKLNLASTFQITMDLLVVKLLLFGIMIFQKQIKFINT